MRNAIGAGFAVSLSLLGTSACQPQGPPSFQWTNTTVSESHDPSSPVTTKRWTRDFQVGEDTPGFVVFRDMADAAIPAVLTAAVIDGKGTITLRTTVDGCPLDECQYGDPFANVELAGFVPMDSTNLEVGPLTITDLSTEVFWSIRSTRQLRLPASGDEAGALLAYRDGGGEIVERLVWGDTISVQGGFANLFLAKCSAIPAEDSRIPCGDEQPAVDSVFVQPIGFVRFSDPSALGASRQEWRPNSLSSAISTETLTNDTRQLRVTTEWQTELPGAPLGLLALTAMGVASANEVFTEGMVLSLVGDQPTRWSLPVAICGGLYTREGGYQCVESSERLRSQILLLGVLRLQALRWAGDTSR